MVVTTPSDGRITSLTSLTSTLAGSEVMYIVSPGNAVLGISYQITLNGLGAFFGGFPFLNTSIVTSGATYNVKTTDTRVLINKTVGSATSVVMPPALTMQYPYGVYIKDLKGDANSHNITITFTSGELVDGLSTVTINNNYGWTTINPVPGASAWYLS